MKYQVVVAFLLSLTSSIANAQSFQADKPVICDDTQKIITSLTETFKEVPIWTAKDGSTSSRYSLFVNEKTGAWTMLQMTPEVSCILGVGEESKIIGTSV